MASKRLPPGIATIDQYRYLRIMGGATVEEIAKQDGVEVSTVQRSVTFYQGVHASRTIPNLQRSQIGIINDLAEIEKKTIEEALQATRTEKDPNGKLVVVPDHAIRLDASHALTEKAAAIMPRGKGITIDVSQHQAQKSGSDQASVQTSNVIGGFEEMLRQVKLKRQQQEEPIALTDGGGQVLGPEPEEDQLGDN